MSDLKNTFGADTDEDVTDWGQENIEDEYRRKFSFDPACYELAEHFLGKDASECAKNDLAQDFQNAAEMATQDTDEKSVSPTPFGTAPKTEAVTE
jgi:hypothetical protein